MGLLDYDLSLCVSDAEAGQKRSDLQLIHEVIDEISCFNIDFCTAAYRLFR